MSNSLSLFAFGSGLASNNPDCALGPWYLYYHPELFNAKKMRVHWDTLIQTTALERGLDVLPLVEDNIKELSQAVLPLAEEKEPFCVIGGDHSCAIGTWSAVAHANRQQGDMGLIWIDAHMDSHTHLTSISKNIHGMPVACLLGEGPQGLSQVLDSHPKLKPENLCIIGVRSYEPAEAALLKRLGVRVFLMDEVQQRGFQAVLTEAWQQVSRTTCGVGLSIDMDAIDPLDAPGVGCPEPKGIRGADLVSALSTHFTSRSLLGLELAEFNPIEDTQGKTAQLLVDLIHAAYPFVSSGTHST
ncbi:MAG: hypothetical protein A3F46_04030 [Legionellales bacterium RIFCSPHIGHO2_12_FULL_42_9]|nr:MAG: hypothetical protein A3F46_04030 [Legionellales bacterium RIFCSPHIGHO2_12_FULL_42_9]